MAALLKSSSSVVFRHLRRNAAVARRSFATIDKLGKELIPPPYPYHYEPEVMWGCSWKIYEKVIHYQLQIPGVSKEQVEVKLDESEEDVIVIKAQCEKDWPDDEAGHSYEINMEADPEQYDIANLQAFLKDGVLDLFVPLAGNKEKKDLKSRIFIVQ